MITVTGVVEAIVDSGGGIRYFFWWNLVFDGYYRLSRSLGMRCLAIIVVVIGYIFSISFHFEMYNYPFKN